MRFSSKSADQLLQHEKQVAFHQPHRNGGADGGEDTEAGRVGDGLFLALLLLFGLPLLIVAAGLLLGMMHRAGWIGADLVDGADVAAFGDDGLGGELAHLELGPLRLVLRLRLLVPNGGVLVARQDGAAFLLLAVGRADLHKLRLRGDGLGDVRIDLGLIAGWVGAASCLPRSSPNSSLLCPVRLGQSTQLPAVGDKLRVALVERRIFQDEQDVALNPELEVADGKQDARWPSVAVGSRSSLKQAESACSCWSAGSFASKSAWPTPISSR